VGVVDDLATAEVLVRLSGAGFPELDEARALRGEVAGQLLQPLIGAISGCGQTQVGDQQGLKFGPLFGGVDSAGCPAR
jgi:hypothetical protein